MSVFRYKRLLSTPKIFRTQQYYLREFEGIWNKTREAPSQKSRPQAEGIDENNLYSHFHQRKRRRSYYSSVSCPILTLRAFAIFCILLKVIFFSALSIIPTYVRCTPANSANCSCESWCILRYF